MQSVGLENAKVTDFGFPACLFICRIAFWPWHTAEFAVMMLNIVLSYFPVWTGPLYSSSLTCFAKMPCPKNWWMGGARTRMMFLSWPEKWLFICNGHNEPSTACFWKGKDLQGVMQDIEVCWVLLEALFSTPAQCSTSQVLLLSCFGLGLLGWLCFQTRLLHYLWLALLLAGNTTTATCQARSTTSATSQAIITKALLVQITQMLVQISHMTTTWTRNSKIHFRKLLVSLVCSWFEKINKSAW